MQDSSQSILTELADSKEFVSQCTEEENKSNMKKDELIDLENKKSDIIPERVTKVIKKAPIAKKDYDYINDEARLMLIDAVENKGEKVIHAAKRLGINYSSAKSIFQTFKKKGRLRRIICKKKGSDFHKLQSLDETPDYLGKLMRKSLLEDNNKVIHNSLSSEKSNAANMISLPLNLEKPLYYTFQPINTRQLSNQILHQDNHNSSISYVVPNILANSSNITPNNTFTEINPFMNSQINSNSIINNPMNMAAIRAIRSASPYIQDQFISTLPYNGRNVNNHQNYYALPQQVQPYPSVTQVTNINQNQFLPLTVKDIPNALYLPENSKQHPQPIYTNSIMQNNQYTTQMVFLPQDIRNLKESGNSPALPRIPNYNYMQHMTQTSERNDANLPPNYYILKPINIINFVLNENKQQ